MESGQVAIWKHWKLGGGRSSVLNQTAAVWTERQQLCKLCNSFTTVAECERALIGCNRRELLQKVSDTQLVRLCLNGQLSQAMRALHKSKSLNKQTKTTTTKESADACITDNCYNVIVWLTEIESTQPLCLWHS